MIASRVTFYSDSTYLRHSLTPEARFIPQTLPPSIISPPLKDRNGKVTGIEADETVAIIASVSFVSFENPSKRKVSNLPC